MKTADCKQNTPEWIALRCGVPTASEASNVITGKGEKSDGLKDYAKRLACDLYAGKNVDAWEGNRYSDRGHEIECEAAAAYAFRTDAEVQEVGFFTTDDKRYGASPDRFVGEDGLLEIKCFPKLHADALIYYSRHKKCPPSRLPQVQMQMWICEKAWCDLMFYHPDLPTLIIRQEPDPKMVRALKMQLAAVIAERDKIVTILRGFK